MLEMNLAGQVVDHSFAGTVRRHSERSLLHTANTTPRRADSDELARPVSGFPK